MIKVCMLGAVDRFNYGDLLLPIILKKKIKSYDSENQLLISNYGIVKSDLSNYGALPSKGLKEFYLDCQKANTSVIIVGGEVLNAEWGNIYSYLNYFFDKLCRFNIKIFRRYGKTVNNIFARYVLSGKTLRPFVLDKVKVNVSNNIIYNGVGGNRDQVKLKKEIRDISLLGDKHVDYISTRDEGIYNKLKTHSINCFLTPDSAILMSTIYQENDFDKLTCLKKNLSFKEDFIFFQISKRELNLFSADKVADKLEKISKEHNCRIILCPIGTAFGHEDQIALKEIDRILENKVSKTFIDDPSIWDIMYLISKSRLYIGSSLHGVITAMSYTVPYLAIRQSTKIEFYLKTWAPMELNEVVSIDNLDLKVSDAFKVDLNKLENSRDRQIKISEQSMSDIYDLLVKSKAQ